MAKKTREETVEPQVPAASQPDCQKMAVCVTLGEPGNPQTEALHQLILVVKREKTLDDAGAALMGLYGAMDLEAQREFVKQLDFTLGVAGNVARSLPERFRVK